MEEKNVKTEKTEVDIGKTINIEALLQSKIIDNRIKQTDIEDILGENEIDDTEYSKMIDPLLKKGIEVIEEDDAVDVEILDEKIEDLSLEEGEVVSEVEEETEDQSAVANYFSEDSVRQYFNEISQYPILTQEEEIELVKRAKAGDKNAEDILVTSNLRLVAKLALKYVKSGVFFLDLVQDGTIGLINAIKRFEPDKGYKLSTYVTWWIKKNIIDSLKEKLNIIKIPNHIFLTYKKITAKEKELQNLNGKKPSDKELEDALGMKTEEIKKIKSIVEGKMLTLSGGGQDSEGREEDMDIEDNRTEEEIEREIDEMNQKFKVGNMLQTLTKRERDIIELYFGIDDEGQKATFKDIGEKMHLSSERVRIIKEKALKKLRHLGKRDIWKGKWNS